MSNKVYSIACDFGSSGGKIFLSKFENDKMTLEEVHRFSLTPIKINNYYYTDFIYMYNELLKGIKKVVDMGVQPSSLGINSWGVDYGYIDKNGELLSNPINYRDTRTIDTIKKLEKIGLGARELFNITGISCMPFNSIMQIYEDIQGRADIVNNASKLLFTPDLFGYFLTWLQEKNSPVFVVATANDITKLPPELLRKGRFDEIFYVNLPNKQEREKIFAIHIGKKRKKDLPNINIKQIVDKTEGYCGADIESIVHDSLEEAFVQKKTKLTTEDILNAIKNTHSISETMKDSLDKMAKNYQERKFKNASL